MDPVTDVREILEAMAWHCEVPYTQRCNTPDADGCVVGKFIVWANRGQKIGGGWHCVCCCHIGYSDAV